MPTNSKYPHSTSDFIQLVFLYCLFALPCGAQVAVYSFGPTGTPTVAVSSSAANTSASSFASFVGSGSASGSGTGSNTAGGGGGAYFTASNWRASDSNYTIFTITPGSGFQVTLSGFSYFYASSSSGPNSLSLFSSADSYSTSLSGSQGLTQAASTIVAADWHQNSATISLTFSEPTTFRLTGTGASGASGVLRLDAVTLSGSVSAIPEPSTYAAIFGSLALAATVWHRRRQRKAV